jgi:hydrogenase maturation protease
MTTDADRRRAPRPDLLIIGAGNTLRGDDGAGVTLVNRLKEYFGPDINAMAVNEPDILLAEKMAAFAEVVIIDAIAAEGGEPFRMVPLTPADRMTPAAGFVTHVFDWGAVLAMAGEVYGKVPKASLLGVAAFSFEISETLSDPCRAAAESAFRFMLTYASAPPV